MIEHPVPQNVTAYQFRLVGDMTLKQFLEFGAGVILAWFIWTLQLPVFIRWPFILLSALAGFALAFMPLEERPLDQWVLAFFKAVYLPTLFNWKKSRRSDFLDFTPRKITDSKPLDTVVKAPAAGLTTLLEAYNLQSRLDQKPDELEKDWLDRQNLIPSLFEEVKVPAKLAAETKEDSAYALNRVFILEMYGARAGWLAGATALGNTDIIIPPEWEFSSDKILSLIKEKYETNGRNCVVAIAHEAKISGIKGKTHQQPDGYQHDRHEFNGIALRDAVINKLNISSQIIMPMNYVQSGEPIELDKTMGRSLGEFAVEMINNEKFGQGGAVDYQGGEFKIKVIDLNDFSGDVKRLTEDMFDKEKMLPTEKYLNYLKTLIGNFDFINRDYLKLQQYILNGHYKKNFK